jgi:hypothetical protein
MPELLSLLSLTDEQRETAEKQSERLSTISEFLAARVEELKDSTFLKDLSRHLPWLGHSMEIAGEALPPLKAATTLLEKVTTINDARTLGLIACTTAYQQSCAEAMWEIGRPAASVAFRSQDAADEVKRRVKDSLKPIEARDAAILDNFSLENCESHQFVITADIGFLEAAKAIGYDDWQLRRLLRIIHWRFRANLRVAVTSGEREHDRFRNFREFLNLGKTDIVSILRDNAEMHVQAFIEKPVLQVEPFALADVYMKPTCDVYSWESFRGRGKPAETSMDLLDTVLARIGDPQFRDAIVIQGPPGSGKSTFTLKLCSELLYQGVLAGSSPHARLSFGKQPARRYRHSDSGCGRRQTPWGQHG